VAVTTCALARPLRDVVYLIDRYERGRRDIAV
jgi:hypothetical protein